MNGSHRRPVTARGRRALNRPGITITVTRERHGWSAVVDDPNYVMARRYEHEQLDRLLAKIAEHIDR